MPQLDDLRWRTIVHRPAARTGALFLDRDGVVIEERHYLHDPAGVALCDGAVACIREARQLGLAVVLVTNQAGIGRGYYGWAEFEAVQARTLELLGAGAEFDAVYASAHRPDDHEPAGAEWRKPGPGMLFTAASDLDLDLSRSMLVGDKLSDLEAGRRAGVGRLVHVSTGHGAAERDAVHASFPDALLLPSLAALDLAGIGIAGEAAVSTHHA